MRNLGALLVFVTVFAVSTSARAETGVIDTGFGDADGDVLLDTSFADIADADLGADADAGADADIDVALEDSDDDDVADTSDTAVVDTEPADTATGTDTGTPADTATAADTAIDTTPPPDTRPAGPGTVTENPNDPFATPGSSDTCDCQTPGGKGGLGGFVALMGLLLVVTRRQHRR